MLISVLAKLNIDMESVCKCQEHVSLLFKSLEYHSKFYAMLFVLRFMEKHYFNIFIHFYNRKSKILMKLITTRL